MKEKPGYQSGLCHPASDLSSYAADLQFKGQKVVNLGRLQQIEINTGKQGSGFPGTGDSSNGATRRSRRSIISFPPMRMNTGFGETMQP